MIISRAPVRISLGGGGTDLKSYYSREGGFLVAAGIDKYIFIVANKRFYDSIRVSYSKTEIVDNLDQMEHRIFRESLKLHKINRGIELVSVADVPANCGLGSSSSFTVSLLNALHAYQRNFVTQGELAEEACQIEIDILGEPIGKQDQYIAAYGGLTALTFERNGHVNVEPLKMKDEAIDELERSILLFHSGIERSASEILSEQNEKSKQGDTPIIDALNKIKSIGQQTRTALENGEIDKFGELMDIHWQTKKALSKKVSNSFIDECYELARHNGASGGKIMGAGGGGFFIFYCRENQSHLKDALRTKGLRPTRFRFDFEGAKILVNMKR